MLIKRVRSGGRRARARRHLRLSVPQTSATRHPEWPISLHGQLQSYPSFFRWILNLCRRSSITLPVSPEKPAPIISKTSSVIPPPRSNSSPHSTHTENLSDNPSHRPHLPKALQEQQALGKVKRKLRCTAPAHHADLTTMEMLVVGTRKPMKKTTWCLGSRQLRPLRHPKMPPHPRPASPLRCLHRHRNHHHPRAAPLSRTCYQMFDQKQANLLDRVAQDRPTRVEQL